jgi:hypothetical protein
LSETLSDNLGPKTLHQLQGKKDGYKKGKTLKFNHPHSNPGPKCRGKNLIYITGQKRYLILAKNENLRPPPTKLCKKYIWTKLMYLLQQNVNAVKENSIAERDMYIFVKTAEENQKD